MSMTTDLEVGWLAGIIDGEGHLSLNPHPTNGKNYPYVMVGSTDLDILEKVLKIAGVGKIYGPSKAKNRVGNLPMYIWKASHRDDVAHVLDMVLSHLCARKQDDALRQIEALKEIKSVARTQRDGIHCARGHVYEETGFYLYKTQRGTLQRNCKVCHVDYSKRWKAKKRLSAKESA